MSNKTFAQKMSEKDGIPLTCPFCGYAWKYGGEMKRATCPSCSNKVDVEEHRTDQNNEK